jgi:hypothetical protein
LQLPEGAYLDIRAQTAGSACHKTQHRPALSLSIVNSGPKTPSNLRAHHLPLAAKRVGSGWQMSHEPTYLLWLGAAALVCTPAYFMLQTWLAYSGSARWLQHSTCSIASYASGHPLVGACVHASFKPLAHHGPSSRAVDLDVPLGALRPARTRAPDKLKVSIERTIWGYR